MPVVTAPPRGNSNGEVVTEFVDSVGTTSTTFSYPTTQDKLLFENTGYFDISLTVNSQTFTVQRNQKQTYEGSFSSFSVQSTNGNQPFVATAFNFTFDAKGTDIIEKSKNEFSDRGINVKWFGAKGDGVADDTAAIQAAINAATTGGGVVYLPRGVYLCTGTITIPANMAVYGAGADKNGYLADAKGTVLKFAVSTATNIDGIVIAGNCVRIKDIYVDGDNTLYNGISMPGTPEIPITNGEFTDVNVGHCRNAGFYTVNCYFTTFERCWSQFNVYGFYMAAGFSIQTVLTFKSCYGLDNTSYGYYLDGVAYSSIISCAADGNSTAYLLRGCRGVTIEASGAERNKNEAIQIDSCIAVTVLSFWGYNNGANVTGVPATLAWIRSGSHIRIQDSQDQEPLSTAASVSNPNAATPVYISNNKLANGVSDLTNKAVVQDDTLSISYLVPGNLTALPTATVADRGRIIRLEGATGIADRIFQCVKLANDTYYWNKIPVYKTGTSTSSGDGATLSRSFTHGLGISPSFVEVFPASNDAGDASIRRISWDGTVIVVTWKTAPIVGTNNVSLNWRAEL